MQAGMASRSLGTHGGWNLKKMHVWQLSWQGLMRRDCLSPQRLIQLRKLSFGMQGDATTLRL